VPEPTAAEPQSHIFHPSTTLNVSQSTM